MGIPEDLNETAISTAMKDKTAHGGAFPSSKGISRCQPRESSDSPRLNAFCRVAPSVRFNLLAMLDAWVFLRANVFSVRTSDDVHERRFEFLAI